MDKKELELIRKIKFGKMSATDLIDAYNENRKNYRIVFFLIQHPSFSQKTALNIIPRLFTIDLIKIIKNRRTNPFIRMRAELEFKIKYNKFAIGEKITYIKIAPLSLLNHFINETNEKIIEAILNNYQCTEEFVLKMINSENSKDGRYNFYRVIIKTDWIKRKTVAEAISYDIKAPVRVLLEILPYLSLENLDRMYKSDNHSSIREGIINYLNNRVDTQEKSSSEKNPPILSIN